MGKARRLFYNLFAHFPAHLKIFEWKAINWILLIYSGYKNRLASYKQNEWKWKMTVIHVVVEVLICQ